MNSATINQFTSIKQEARKGDLTRKEFSFTKLIHNIVREYGVYVCGSYCVDLDKLSKGDVKLLVSHVISAEDYEDACKSDTYLKEMFLEVRKYLEKLIDLECDQVYRENMEEMGMVCMSHPDNNESYWVHR